MPKNRKVEWSSIGSVASDFEEDAKVRLSCVTILTLALPFAVFGTTTLSTGVEIPSEGVPTWKNEMQYTTRMEKRPAAITDESAYLKWKWRMDLADPKTGLDNDALRAGVKKIAKESGWKDGKEDWYDVAVRCFEFLVDNVAIGFSKYDCFPAISAWERKFLLYMNNQFLYTKGGFPNQYRKTTLSV